MSGAPIGWPVSASHNRTVWSQLAEARRCPSGLNATLATGSVCPVKGWSASQNRIVWSTLAETSRCPSGLNVTLDSASVCPVSGGPRALPVSAFHNRTVLSALAEARR